MKVGTLSWECAHDNSLKVSCFSFQVSHEPKLTRFHSIALTSQLCKFLFQGLSISLKIDMTYYILSQSGSLPHILSPQKLNCIYCLKVLSQREHQVELANIYYFWPTKMSNICSWYYYTSYYSIKPIVKYRN